MAEITQIRGILLEEVVLFLLQHVGYRIITHLDDGTRPGPAGLEVQGRGTWHQIDALAAFDRTPAFMYPLRLMVEAKCYERSRKVGIDIVRNAVGVLKDISENYFTIKTNRGADSVQAQRYNYHAAIFSSSSYTRGAQNYALAHQIFLIQYERVRIIRPIVEAILDMRDSSFEKQALLRPSEIRKYFRQIVESKEVKDWDKDQPFTADGLKLVSERIIPNIQKIQGSYFGMLQGRWPLHLLAKDELPGEAFQSDEILCKIWGRDSENWSFVPSQYTEDDPRWFRLEFDLPEEIAKMLVTARFDAEQAANVKKTYLNYLDVSGKIGGIQRQVRLKLDEEWIAAYSKRARKRRKPEEE